MKPDMAPPKRPNAPQNDFTSLTLMERDAVTEVIDSATNPVEVSLYRYVVLRVMNLIPLGSLLCDTS